MAWRAKPADLERNSSHTIRQIAPDSWGTTILEGRVLTLLVLDLALDIVDGVRALHFQCDGLASQSLDEDLHATTQTQDQVEGGLLLDIVVCKSAAIFQLLASEDQSLLVRGDAYRYPIL